MGQLISLNITNRGPLNEQLPGAPKLYGFDVEDIVSPIRFDVSLNKSYFTARTNKGLSVNSVNTSKIDYRSSDTLSSIYSKSNLFVLLTVISRRGVQVNSESYIFVASKICENIVPVSSGSLFYYIEDGDPLPVEYIVSQTPSQIVSQTIIIPGLNIQNSGVSVGYQPNLNFIGFNLSTNILSQSIDITSNQSQLNQEILDRAAADTALQNNINSESNRITTLENNEYKILYFATISAATGAITKPANSTIILDQFYSGGDAIVETLVNGQPSGQSPLTSGGSVVSVSSFDINGNYTLSGTPSSFDVAILYVITIKAIHYSNIIKSYELNREETNLAPLNSPIFTGVPEAPTPTTKDNTNKIATTKFVFSNTEATLHRDSTDSTPLTGTTSQTLASSYLLPANTIAPNYSLINEVYVNKTGGAGTVTLRVLYNSSASLSGATILATYTTAVGTTSAGFTRRHRCKSATVTEQFNVTTSALADMVASSTTAISQLNIDWTVNQYIILSLQLANGSDTTWISDWRSMKK